MLNFLGSGDEHGIRIILDSEQVAIDKKINEEINSLGNGRIAVGRRFSESDERHASVQMDELLFFDEALTDAEITMLGKSMLDTVD